MIFRYSYALQRIFRVFIEKKFFFNKIINLYPILMLFFNLPSTLNGSSKSKTKVYTNEKPLEKVIDEKNRLAISLLGRIRKLPRIAIRIGVPIFIKGNNAIGANVEPLYIIDNYAVGNSFNSANDLVESVNVRKIVALSSSDASFYGSRASNGVIQITTYK